jgi:hypothetical protein
MTIMPPLQALAIILLVLMTIIFGMLLGFLWVLIKENVNLRIMLQQLQPSNTHQV